MKTSPKSAESTPGFGGVCFYSLENWSKTHISQKYKALRAFFWYLSGHIFVNYRFKLRKNHFCSKYAQKPPNFNLVSLANRFLITFYVFKKYAEVFF